MTAPDKATTKSRIAFEGGDFTTSETLKQRCIALVFGDAGSGKTTFVTDYCPDPIALINYDQRSVHAVPRARGMGRKIFPAYISLPRNMSRLAIPDAKKAAREIVGRTVRNLEIALRESERGNVRTIALDTGTEYSEILRYAAQGHLEKATDYGAGKDWINRQWWDMFNAARSSDVNFIVLARASAVWANNEPTGEYTYKGPAVMDDGVDWSALIRIKKRLGKASASAKVKQEFEMKVAKAGVNISEKSQVYASADWGDMGGPFAYACMMMYEGTTPEDWK